MKKHLLNLISHAMTSTIMASGIWAGIPKTPAMAKSALKDRHTELVSHVNASDIFGTPSKPNYAKLSRDEICIAEMQGVDTSTMKSRDSSHQNIFDAQLFGQAGSVVVSVDHHGGEEGASVDVWNSGSYYRNRELLFRLTQKGSTIHYLDPSEIQNMQPQTGAQVDNAGPDGHRRLFIRYEAPNNLNYQYDLTADRFVDGYNWVQIPISSEKIPERIRSQVNRFLSCEAPSVS